MYRAWAIPFGCRQCLIYLSCTLLGPRSLGMAMSDLYFFLYLAWEIPLEHWQCLVCFLALCACIVCAWYIYVHACLKIVMHFSKKKKFRWSCTLYDGFPWLGGYSSPNHGCSWTWSVGMHSRQLLYIHIHATLCAWLSMPCGGSITHHGNACALEHYKLKSLGVVEKGYTSSLRLERWVHFNWVTKVK